MPHFPIKYLYGPNARLSVSTACWMVSRYNISVAVVLWNSATFWGPSNEDIPLLEIICSRLPQSGACLSQTWLLKIVRSTSPHLSARLNSRAMRNATFCNDLLLQPLTIKHSFVEPTPFYRKIFQTWHLFSYSRNALFLVELENSFLCSQKHPSALILSFWNLVTIFTLFLQDQF
jgi:hypothetical protein